MGILRNLVQGDGRSDVSGWGLAFDAVHKVWDGIEPLVIYINLVQVDIV